ncbi:hypothetical protein [Singulisphaera acidiphila]|uniref:Uncharacterized protein n=1 Tax=Singulisphaera acidiphila (strain ATCC BAA-1392 / DSM 18658 / VKM B-2454 / MOB10) TaxID=886293 RepID=L0DFL1_SINAD|nr:hypothetical protein [Singulisphaera acidiphila]AGA27603.1 hypothetical protein Sinac_3336 [Singulisphaera acidiphila DSM 18658]
MLNEGESDKIERIVVIIQSESKRSMHPAAWASSIRDRVVDSQEKTQGADRVIFIPRIGSHKRIAGMGGHKITGFEPATDPVGGLQHGIQREYDLSPNAYKQNTQKSIVSICYLFTKNILLDFREPFPCTQPRP